MLKSLCPIASYSRRRYKQNRKRRELTKDYIRILLKTDTYEPDDIEVKVHLELQSRSSIEKLDWVDAEVMGIPSALSSGTGK